MTNRIFIGRPVGPVGQPSPAQPQRPQTTVPAGAFKQALDAAMAHPIKLSGHAQDRLAASKRTLTETELTQIAQAVDRAAQKGARDALIMMQDLALVVSVKNRTVITAVDGDRMKENIFTNIDSAVIL